MLSANVSISFRKTHRLVLLNEIQYVTKLLLLIGNDLDTS